MCNARKLCFFPEQRHSSLVGGRGELSYLRANSSVLWTSTRRRLPMPLPPHPWRHGFTLTDNSMGFYTPQPVGSGADNTGAESFFGVRKHERVNRQQLPRPR